MAEVTFTLLAFEQLRINTQNIQIANVAVMLVDDMTSDFFKHLLVLPIIDIVYTYILPTQ